MSTETYLGDGLYASFDGSVLWLRVPRENGDHLVALEPEVWLELVKFVEALPTKKAQEGDSKCAGCGLSFELCRCMGGEG